MLYKLFKQAMDSSIITAASRMPKNLRQWYADQLLLMKIEAEYGF